MGNKGTMKNFGQLILLLSCTLPAQEAATDTINGRIITLLGEPVHATPVEITTYLKPDTVIARGFTDGDGYFRIARVPVTKGRRLRARSADLCIETKGISGAGSPQVLKAQDATTVRGVLRDKSGRPVPGTPVRSSLVSRAMRDVIRDSVTDDAGRFVIENVPLGMVRFQAVVPDEGIAVATISIPGETEVEVRTADLDTTTLRICVKGLPAELLPELVVSLLPYANGGLSRFPPPWDKSQFGDDGVWSLNHVPNCRYIIYPHAEGYVFTPRQFTLKAGTGPHDLTYKATPSGSANLQCRVVVRDARGEPVAGVTFEMRASNGGNRSQATSGADGAMVFQSPLARGEGAVVYSVDDRWVTDQPLEQGFGSDARDATWHRFKVDPEQPVAVRLIPACEVTGQVVLTDGRPAAFARVQLEVERVNTTPRWRAFSWATADRQGSFRFRGRHPMKQAVRLVVEGSRGAFVGEPFALDTAGQKVAVPELKLSPIAIIEGVVTNGEQKVAPGVRVWLRDWDMATGRQRSGSVTETITDKNGGYRFRGVPTGGAWLQTLGAGASISRNRAVEPFDVEAGKTYTCDIQLPATGR
jgi:hypothetical protein